MNSIRESRDAAIAAFVDDSPARLNCAQAVVLFMAKTLGQDPKLTTLATYMGGGGAGMGEMCGALAGAVLALGMRDYFAPEGATPEVAANKALAQQIIGDFEATFGQVTCRALTGHDLRTKEGYAAFKADPISGRCADYIAWVCDRLGAAL